MVLPAEATERASDKFSPARIPITKNALAQISRTGLPDPGYESC